MREIVIQGEPIAMQRPRVTRGRAYNPQAALKKRCQAEVKAQWRGDPLTGPLQLSIQFYYARDNKDLDNCVKWVCDVLQGIVYRNDLQVRELWAGKRADKKEPRTIIFVGWE